MQTAVGYLKEKSIKASAQRILIMDFLLKNRIHPTVDEIYMALSPNMPTLSRTTVYNTMKLFADHGALQVLEIDEKNAHYDVDTSLHAHFYCIKCGKIFDINDENLYHFEKKEVNGMRVFETHLNYKGLCNNCDQEKNNNN